MYADFYLNETGKINVEYKKNNEYVNPLTVKIKIIKPSGEIDEEEMDNEGTGKFYKLINFLQPGKWIFYIEATDGAGNRQIDKYFVWVLEK
ncbi:MAG: hypothetical protein H5T45_01500 [Thermoplasmatales archaeon]|nr:hypothetical protein [Thermoplasmatales archaeon]